MDVAGAVAALVAVATLVTVGVMEVQWRLTRRRLLREGRQRIDRELRRIQLRRCQLYRSRIGHDAAMRRAADRVDGVAR